MAFPYIPSFIKDPTGVLDFNWDWTEWLGESETILNMTVTPAAGLAAGNTSVSDGVATAWLSGGADGNDYPVTCTISTSAGRTDSRRILVSVRMR